jgi:hypothetical protein
MDKAEKMDCSANGEVIFWATSLLLSQSSKMTDPISQRIGSIGRRKEVRYPDHSNKEQRIVLTGSTEKG